MISGLKMNVQGIKDDGYLIKNYQEYIKKNTNLIRFLQKKSQIILNLFLLTIYYSVANEYNRKNSKLAFTCQMPYKRIAKVQRRLA